MECRRRVQRNNLSHIIQCGNCVFDWSGNPENGRVQSDPYHFGRSGQRPGFIFRLFYFFGKYPDFTQYIVFLHNKLFFFVFWYRYNILCKNIIYYVNFNVFINQKFLEKVKVGKLHIKLYFFHFVSRNILTPNVRRKRLAQPCG